MTNAEIKKVQYEIPGAKPGEKFTDEKTVISIVTTKPSEVTDVAFRAIDIVKDPEGNVTKNDVLLFGSTRGGQIVPVPEGYMVDVPEGLELVGKDYELKAIALKKVIASGKIFKASTEAASLPAEAVGEPTFADVKSKTKKEKTL